MTDAVSGGQLLIAVPIALLAGVVSFASPCVLPLVPGYLAYIGGFTDGRTAAKRSERSRMTLGVALFVLGFAVVFVATTYVVTSAGFWLLHWDDLVTRVAGAVVVVLGLVFIGRIRGAQRTMKPLWRPATGLAGAPLLGAVFAIGWSPCIGPTLGAISAMSWHSPVQGSALAFIYALGIGIPFLLIALGLDWTVGAVAFLKRHVRAINLVGGSMLIVLGLIMVSGLWGLWMNDLKGV
ncbi:MAG TPA: cytochrome c biogenesis protein CcdA, partial [Pseudolysinimonas sp.]|nr:cytochrome c biogenesis protein CcdA [Pseudolysinimonas sp.]